MIHTLFKTSWRSARRADVVIVPGDVARLESARVTAGMKRAEWRTRGRGTSKVCWGGISPLVQKKRLRRYLNRGRLRPSSVTPAARPRESTRRPPHYALHRTCCDRFDYLIKTPRAFATLRKAHTFHCLSPAAAPQRQAWRRVPRPLQSLEGPLLQFLLLEFPPASVLRGWSSTFSFQIEKMAGARVTRCSWFTNLGSRLKRSCFTSIGGPRRGDPLRLECDHDAAARSRYAWHSGLCVVGTASLHSRAMRRSTISAQDENAERHETWVVRASNSYCRRGVVSCWSVVSVRASKRTSEAMIRAPSMS